MSEPAEPESAEDESPSAQPTAMRTTLEATRQFYAAPPDQNRVRRATDIVLLSASLLALVGVILAQPPGSFQRSILVFLESLPSWLDPVWGFLIGLLALWTVVMLIIPLISRRPRITLEAVLAVVLAVGLGLLAARFATGSWPDSVDTSGLSNDLHFPTVRLAIAAAVIAVVNGQLARPVSGTGRYLLALGGLAAVVEGRTTIGGAAAAILIGIAAGATIRLALGTSAGRPTLKTLSNTLGKLGVEAHDLRASERQIAGVYSVEALDSDGTPLAIRVYGRDAYDNQLLERLWRTAIYRDGGVARAFSRGDPAEREALLTLLAKNVGVPTPEVVTAGVTPSQDSLLVLRESGRPLASLTADEIGDDDLRSCWTAVDTLARGHLAHRQIGPATIRLDGSRVTLTDLGGGTVAPSDEDRLSDRAQLLSTTATVVGTERAMQAAIAAIGQSELAALLPYLQPAAMHPSLRRALKAAEIDVDDLRAAAATAAGAEKPELAQLRRVTLGTVVQLALLVFAVAAVLSFAGDIDWNELQEDLQSASWGWIIAAAIVAQTPRLTQAISTLGSIPVRLAYGPVYILQLATSYMNLALPSSIARMAVSIRFFQRRGVSPAIAVTSGAIDSFTNTIVQALLLILLLTFSSATLNLDLDAPDSAGIKRLVAILIGVAVVLIIATLVLPRGRRALHALRDRIRIWWPQVRGTFAALRGSHKLAQLILGNVATEVLFATSLGMFALGLGFHLSLTQLIVINTSVSLFATFIPVPGGIGVVEGGLLVGLTAAGMPESAAFATTLLYRISTFYLPPIWGYFALNWLRKNRYL